MEKSHNKPHPFWLRVKQLLLDIALELLGVVICLVLGAGILAQFGHWEVLKNLDLELTLLVGAVAILIIFAITFTVISFLRKKK